MHAGINSEKQQTEHVRYMIRETQQVVNVARARDPAHLHSSPIKKQKPKKKKKKKIKGNRERDKM